MLTGGHNFLLVETLDDGLAQSMFIMSRLFWRKLTRALGSSSPLAVLRW